MRRQLVFLLLMVALALGACTYDPKVAPVLGININLGGWYPGWYEYGPGYYGYWRPGHMAWVCEWRPYQGRVCYEKWTP